MIKGYSFSGFEQYEQRFERLLIPARKRCSSFTMSIWHSPTPIRGKPARLELPRASQEQCKNEPGGWQDGVPSCRLHLRQVLDDEHSCIMPLSCSSSIILSISCKPHPG